MIKDGLFELIHDADPEELAKLTESDLLELGARLTSILNSPDAPFEIINARFDRARLMLK